ncbi:hypothetical protein SAMN05216223_101146 [Actinacidiphila yanglinensis]|uniref:MYXO-CTERM domain-containing protein n=1 Tax=Actinacidiphila yanglinensis TaxID=310779 RepID=A0A1H5SIC1_9ACTN|nr:SCO2322 family protein [Actinacidiphila yanglinensis]SEF50433.1 hypothetical protein SAMN05216223_101146 [Actinacidiphila yanglinensis]
MSRPGAGAGISPGARRTAWVAAVAVVAAVLLAAAAVPASATGYRYWSYWLRSGGSWTYAQTGPAMHTPKDGTVEGWRFAVSKDAAAAAVRPRGAATFTAICGGTPAASGKKRIALVIDPGTTADAPGGARPPAPRTACALIPTDASSADALAAVARPLRYDSAGILCAISGYPTSGCGEQVAAGSSSGAVSHHGGGHSGGPVLGTLAGAAGVLAIAGFAIRQNRRRRS